MSEHPREAERRLKRIFICDDVWYGIFALSERAILGLKLAPLCARFDGLVDRHLRTIRWTLGNIKICSTKDDTRAKDGDGQDNNGVILEDSALLDVSPPSRLVGFNQIEIKLAVSERCIDSSVITFLQKVSHLYNNVDDITLLLPLGVEFDDWHTLDTLWPFFAPKLHKLVVGTSVNFIILMFSMPTVLRDCANLGIIHVYEFCSDMPANETKKLATWLHTPRSDSRPKVLKFNEISQNTATKLLEILKMTFVKADLPVSYIVCVRILGPFLVGPFECENGRTRERMTFQRTLAAAPYQDNYPDYHDCLFRRGPISWDESQWAESDKHLAQRFGDFTKEKHLISFEDVAFCSKF